MPDKFQHGIDYQAAKEYLQEIGGYEKVVQSAKEQVFGNNYPQDDRFLIIIAANEEYRLRNELIKK